MSSSKFVGLPRELVVSKTKGFMTADGVLEFLTFLIKTEVIFMLYGVLAVISAIIAVVSFLYYQRSADNRILFVAAIIFLLLTLGFGAMFLAGRVNKTEDIHITE
jgi:heme/copper-type cytochrome/quinol oxidase subunit 4